MTQTEAMAAVESPSLPEVRDRLGYLWGLGRPLTRAELARALDLSDPHGGEHVSKVEKGKANLSPTAWVAIRMMLEGAVPHTMANIVRPGYPRGRVR